MKIAVIGAGLIGRAWAVVFARGGHEVALFDAVDGQADRAKAWTGPALAEMAERGLVTGADAIAGRIRVAAGLEQALDGAGYLQENIAERLEPKQALFAEIEAKAAANCIFGSSSSAIMPSLIFGKMKDPSRTLVAHPMNPPHLAPVVELCGSDVTDAGSISFVSTLMTGCGMSVVEVKREIGGFILNRLQLAVLNEAFRLIEGGFVSAEDLDKTLKDGLALRWAFMGPVETMDLNAPGGVRDYIDRYGPAIRKVGGEQKLAADWTNDVVDSLEAWCQKQRPHATVAEAQALRDRRMMALLALKAFNFPS